MAHMIDVAIVRIEKTNSSPGCEIPSPGCEIPSPGCEIPSPGCEIPSPGCEIPSPGCEIPSPGCEIPSPGCETTHSQPYITFTAPASQSYSHPAALFVPNRAAMSATGDHSRDRGGASVSGPTHL
eukprot:1195636-Prorocentrum_minimum.AAC.10